MGDRCPHGMISLEDDLVMSHENAHANCFFFLLNSLSLTKNTTSEKTKIYVEKCNFTLTNIKN